MGCPPVCGSRSFASGLSYVQVDKHGIDLPHHEIFRAKVGNGGINSLL